MARMHSGSRGKAGSKRPVEKTERKWINYSKEEIEKIIAKLAKSGKSQSEIGMILRDQYGIPRLRGVIQEKMSRVLAKNKIKPQLPEDIVSLIKKEILILKHLEKNKKDMPARRGLMLTESKIKRLVKYYKRKGVLPEDWTYSKEQAKFLVE